MSGDADVIEIRPYRPGDEHEILKAFHKVFPWAKRSLEAWCWQYRDAPLGVHCFLAVLPSGQVVAQYTGVPRRVKLGSEERVFAEMVDSLSDPDFRQGLKKPGLFGRTLSAYVAHFGRPDRECVMYGLPNPVAYRIGNRFFNYNDFYKIEALEHAVADLPDAACAIEGAAGVMEEVAAFPPDTDALWARVRDRLDVATIRDHAYLTWRYVQRPDATYRKLAFRDPAGVLAGLVVMRDAWLFEETGVRATAVADWVVDRAHPLAAAVPRAILRPARDAGAAKVQIVFRPGSEEWVACEKAGYHPAPTKFRLVGGTYDFEAAPLRRLIDGWFITLGDFDVI